MCEADLPGLSGGQVEELPPGAFIAAQMDLPKALWAPLHHGA